MACIRVIRVAENGQRFGRARLVLARSGGAYTGAGTVGVRTARTDAIDCTAQQPRGRAAPRGAHLCPE